VKGGEEVAAAVAVVVVVDCVPWYFQRKNAYLFSFS
jgi:hypothetical protein